MSSPINHFSSQYLVFLAVKTSLQSKIRTNQVCEVRFIPGLKLFCFWEYGPMRSRFEEHVVVIMDSNWFGEEYYKTWEDNVLEWNV